MNTVGFHEGELAVQRRAGVGNEAARLEGMLAPARLGGGIAAFLAQRELAVITGRDGVGRLWTSPLAASAGFLQGDGTTLRVGAAPGEGDPLHAPPIGQEVGLMAIDFAIRRRVRVNGTLAGADDKALLIDARQAYGNCPSYIQRRAIRPVPADERPVGREGSADGASEGITPDQARVITGADTFFLGTSHPTRGADTSHKGGPAGFVRIEGPELWWPDYAGNNMFNSMGNIAVDPAASLLFLDFGAGLAVQLSGTAELRWTPPGVPGDDDSTGRRVVFRPERTLTTALALRAAPEVEYSPHNPALRN